MHKFPCPHCGQRVAVDDSFEEPTGVCPSCGGNCEVPRDMAALPQATPPSSRKSAPAEARVDHQPGRKVRLWSTWPFRASLASIFAIAVVKFVQSKGHLDEIGGTGERPVYLSAAILGTFTAAAAVALVAALIIAAFAAGAKKRFKATFARGYSIGLVIVTVMMLARIDVTSPFSMVRNAFGTFSRQKSERATLAGIEKDMELLLKESTGEDGLPRKTDFRFGNSTPGSGEKDPARELMRASLDDMLQIQNDYIARLEADGLETLLDPKRIDADTDFKESREILARLRLTTERFRAKAEETVRKFPNRIEALEVPAAVRKGMVRGYNDVLPATLSRLKETWDLETASIAHMSSLVDLLEERRARWKNVDGAFIFDLDADAQKFNAILAKMNEGAQRQMEIRDQAIKSAKDQLGGNAPRLSR